MLRNKCLYGLALLMAALLAVSVYSAPKNGNKSTSNQSVSSAMSATAGFEEVTVKGKVCKKLMVTLEHAKPNTTYNVFMNDELVGTITTNKKGKGKVDVRDASFMTSDSQRPRNGFPMLHKGDPLPIGPLTSVVVEEAGGSSGGGGGDTGGGDPGSGTGGDPGGGTAPQTYQLQGELAGYGSVWGTATYSQMLDSNGVLNRSFEVTYDDGIPMHLLFVMINGEVWLNLMTDANGQAHVLMQSNPAPDATDVWPMPDAFPSIRAGDTVSVGLGSATMAATSG